MSRLPCSKCQGTGKDWENPSFPCPVCGGRRAGTAAPVQKTGPKQLDIMGLLRYDGGQPSKEPMSIVNLATLGHTAPVKHPPTPEQQAVIDASRTGKSIVIEALAGAGKTTTMRFVAEANKGRRGLYLAYNKVTAEEAKASFPSNVQCMTAHSLAYRNVGYRFRDRLNAKRVPPWELASWLGINSEYRVCPGVSMSPMFTAGRVIETIRNFCYSAELEPRAWHVPRVNGTEDHRAKVQNYVMRFAKKMWADLQNEQGYCPFSHDVYLKMYVLSEPTLDYDFIIMDEAQDANALTLELFTAQDHAQLIAVGDKNQQLYGWRGSLNSMETLDFTHKLTLSKSFRFGPVVAAEGQKWLDLLGGDQHLEGFDKIDSRLEDLPEPDAVLCRTNATVVMEAIEAQAMGLKVAIVGGTADLEKLAKAAGDLQRGKRVLHPDIAAFESWDQVREYSLQPEGSDLRTFVKLIDEHGSEGIQRVTKAAVSEERADIIVSTGHRSKGREWDHVRIAHDFEDIVDEDGQMSREAMMLAYVCVTRAQKVLDRGGLAFVDQLLKGSYERGY